MGHACRCPPDENYLWRNARLRRSPASSSIAPITNAITWLGKPSWPDPVRLSEIEDRFVCQACGNAQIGQLKIGSIGSRCS
jgi:hypothetical protein